MSAFDKVIGYSTIKNELLQICDMIHNRNIYEALGAKLPRGLLLHGAPGLGKTLMANCFIEESGLKAFVIRKNKSADNFVGYITDTFAKAKDNAPAIVFLDDLDKFANEDNNHRDAEEYVAVLSGIDDVKEYDVFILATANAVYKLPNSLVRSGRFDRKIDIQSPTMKDAIAIIKYYLSDKKVSESVNMEDLSRMINYSSCAELETILNESAIIAASKRKSCIEMDDLTKAVLRREYDSPDNYVKTSDKDMKITALHEAGHLVVCEVLEPGSVGLASLRSTGRSSSNGFIHRCSESQKRSHHILTSLGGKAAVELYYSGSCVSGCENDLQRAYTAIRVGISECGTNGLGMFEVSSADFPDQSESAKSRTEAVTYAELERYLFMAKDILLKNRAFLEKATDALIEKETLLYSDIQRIKSSVTITTIAG